MSKASKSYEYEDVLDYVNEMIDEIQRDRIYELISNNDLVRRARRKKEELRKALKLCSAGDGNSKAFVKDIIKDIILSKYTEEGIDKIIDYSNEDELCLREKFDICMYVLKKKYGFDAMTEFIKRGAIRTSREIYEIDIIDEEFLNCVYKSIDRELSIYDRLELVTQRVYSDTRGLSVIDELRDMHIDGVSAGVCADELKSVYIMYSGRTIHIKVLSFRNAWDLERVCRNIYRYDSHIYLSESKGYVIGEMADKSRVVVARTPFAESWVTFVRKFDNVKVKTLKSLITDENWEIPATVLKWLIKGCQTIAITGQQGGGKTTLLMALIAYVDNSYNLRVLETNFELNLRSIYKDRNIISFRETDTVSGQEGLDFQKKTDGSVNIIGEVATAKVASYMIQAGQTASLFTLFTHHATSADNLLYNLRNSLLTEANFNNERIALEQVCEVVKYNVHMAIDTRGHRYIERITQIICDYENVYKTQDIVVYDNGRYVMINDISDRGKEEIKRHLTREEGDVFEEELLSL